jgi:hypothetical protein
MMDDLLKRLGVDREALRLAYLFGREQGRRFLRGAMIFPGIRVADLEKVAARNGEAVTEMIAKRDLMLDSTIAFVEEFVNLDED